MPCFVSVCVMAIAAVLDVMLAALKVMDPKWRAGGGGGRGYPSADDIKYKHAPFRPSPTAGKPMKGDFSRGAPPMAGAGPAPATVPASGAHAPGGRQAGSRVAPGGQRGSHFQQRHQFEQTMATVTAQMDDALMSEAARCQQLEDELKLLREDMYLEKATNNDLKAELRELRRVNETLQQERSQNYGTIGTLGTQKQFLQEDHQQLLHEIQVLRASEERLNRQVQRLSDENGELRSYWEDGFSELKAQRTASINDQMLADAARKGEAARAQRREKILLAEKEHATNMVRARTHPCALCALCARQVAWLAAWLAA